MNEIKEDYDKLQLDIAEHSFNDVVNRIYQESKMATRMAERATRENRIGDATEQTAINTIRMQYAVLAAEKALKVS